MTAYYPILVETALVLVNLGYLVYLFDKHRVSLLSATDLHLERIKRTLVLLFFSLPSALYYLLGYSTDATCLIILLVPIASWLMPLVIQMPKGFELTLLGRSQDRPIEIHLKKANQGFGRQTYQDLLRALKLLRWAGFTRATMTSPLFVGHDGQARKTRVLVAKLSALEVTATGRRVQPSLVQRLLLFWGKYIRRHRALQSLPNIWYQYELLIEDTIRSTDPAQLHNRPLD